jgi:hypothetical protein
LIPRVDLGTRKKKREKMSKNEPTRSANHIVWRLHGDAIRPKDAPWGFVVQNPVQRIIQPGQKAVIDTGVAANAPLVAWPRGDQGDYVSMPLIVPGGQTLSVTVENKSRHSPLVIDDCEALANVHPLSWSGTSEVD